MVVGLFVALAWCYWPTLSVLFWDWQEDDNYSVGQLIPLVVLFLFWRQRKTLVTYRPAPYWWGIGLILLAQAIRTVGILGLHESMERYSLVVTIHGIVLLVAGWQIYRQSFWTLILLFLMIPLPGRIHNLINAPLQGIATSGAAFLLEVFGATLHRQGNVILLNHRVPLGVAEACNGLRMLTAFVIVAATLAHLIKRPLWQKIILLISSIPIAIACNIVRLFVTARLLLVTDTETAEFFFHTFAGLAMMPLAIGVLAGEIWLMDRLVSVESAAGTAEIHALKSTQKK